MDCEIGIVNQICAFIKMYIPGAHPAYFKRGGGSKKNSISHSGADPKHFGRGDESLN